VNAFASAGGNILRAISLQFANRMTELWQMRESIHHPD
jgi:hypothetical protein